MDYWKMYWVPSAAKDIGCLYNYKKIITGIWTGPCTTAQMYCYANLQSVPLMFVLGFYVREGVMANINVIEYILCYLELIIKVKSIFKILAKFQKGMASLTNTIFPNCGKTLTKPCSNEFYQIGGVSENTFCWPIRTVNIFLHTPFKGTASADVFYLVFYTPPGPIRDVLWGRFDF